jgi:hypothetical protein
MEGRCEEMRNINKNKGTSSEEELSFMLWTSELSKELLSFWESILDSEEE